MDIKQARQQDFPGTINHLSTFWRFDPWADPDDLSVLDQHIAVGQVPLTRRCDLGIFEESRHAKSVSGLSQ